MLVPNAATATAAAAERDEEHVWFIDEVVVSGSQHEDEDSAHDTYVAASLHCFWQAR